MSRRVIYVYEDVAFERLEDAKRCANDYLLKHLPDISGYYWEDKPLMSVQQIGIIWRGRADHTSGLRFTVDIKEMSVA